MEDIREERREGRWRDEGGKAGERREEQGMEQKWRKGVCQKEMWHTRQAPSTHLCMHTAQLAIAYKHGASNSIIHTVSNLQQVVGLCHVHTVLSTHSSR